MTCSIGYDIRKKQNTYEERGGEGEEENKA